MNGVFCLTRVRHQIDQPKEIVEAKMAATRGNHHERIRVRSIRPVGGNSAQPPGGIMEVQPRAAPAVPLHHELKLLRA